jgi:hypothetical protein
VYRSSGLRLSKSILGTSDLIRARHINTKMNDHKKIVLLNWNADGLRNKTDELNKMLREHDVDVASITETHLKNTLNIDIPDYKIYRVNRETTYSVRGFVEERNRGVGGVALLVRENIISQTQIPLDDLCLECLDAVAVSIIINNKPTLMVSAYRPPKKMNIDDFVKLMGRNESVIIAGDLNSKHDNWGCRVDNQSGRKLHTWIAQNRYTILAPTDPTHIPRDRNKLPDILDVVVTKSFPFSGTKQETLAGHSSDHKPVKITFYW